MSHAPLGKLVIEDLHFSYAPQAPEVLSALTLTIEPGEYWCLAGPNGSGKSTLLKLISGLLPAALLRQALKGTVSWSGEQIQKWLTSERRLELARQIAFVPSTLKTQFPVSVEEFVLHGRYARGPYWSHASRQDHEAAATAIERVGITTKRGKLITELSAGETQLAMIARALAQEPKLLILDEATSSLDPGFQARIFGLLHDLHAQGMGILVVSHDLNLAAEFCPQTLWLNAGKLYAKGPTKTTLTKQLLADLYGIGEIAEVGQNPITGKPKVFWKSF